MVVEKIVWRFKDQEVKRLTRHLEVHMTALSYMHKLLDRYVGWPYNSTIVEHLRQCSRREILRDTEKSGYSRQPDGRCSQGCKRDIRSVIWAQRRSCPVSVGGPQGKTALIGCNYYFHVFANGARPLAAQHSPSRGPGASCSPPRFLNLVRHTHFVSSYTMHINIMLQLS